MAHLQYLPGDPHLVDQLVYELKSKGIFDQFRKDCIADVDTRPAYQNLRQRVETSVTTFLSRQCWQPDLNKNQLREKLRKHILDGNYLEQGVERIVDQVVNPKVASVFIPQVEDLVYNYLGITRKKAVDNTETSNGKVEDLLPTDLEAVSPGSVKSNDDKNEGMDVDTVVETKLDSEKMEDEEEKPKSEEKNEIVSASETNHVDKEKIELQESELSATSELTSHDSSSIDKITIPLPSENIKLENIPPPGSSPLKPVEFAKKELSKDINCSVNIPLPGENNKEDKESYFKPINSDDDDSSSDSSLRRNMSPLTPIRNFNNENSCDAQQGFDNDSSDSKNDEKKEPNQTSSFRFAIEAKSADNGSEASKTGKKPNDQLNLAYQFNNQVTINTFNTPMYEDSSNSNLLHIDYESDANSKVNLEQKIVEAENSEDSKKERKPDERKGSHKSSHRSRDSHKHTSSKDRRSESKHSTSRDSSKQEKKSKEDTRRSKSNQKEGSKDKNDKKDSKESSRHSTHKSSSHKDSKSHKTSSSSQRHSSKSTDDKKSSSSHKEKSDKGLYKSSKDKLKESKSSSRSDKDKKSNNKSKHEDKDKEKKEKKESDDHYSLSGRGNPNRRSTDRDSNDGSSSSKGSNNPPNPNPSESKKDSKNGSSKSDNMTTTSESTSPSDRELTLQEKEKEVIDMLQPKPIVRLESHLETPIVSPPNLAFVPDVKLKKPKFAANLEEAKKLIKMRKFLDEEQKRMNQEAALLLEFQANVRPSLSRIYSSIPGPELEFACVKHTVVHTSQTMTQNNDGDHENIVYASEQSNYAEDEGFSDHVEDDVPSTLTVREVEESIESINEELNNKAKAHAYEEILSKETYESTQAEDTFIKSERFSSGNINSNDAMINYNYQESIVKKKPATVNAHKKSTEYFEVTIITEEISDNGETLPKTKETKVVGRASNRKVNKTERVHPEQSDFHYFGEHEKYKAELERDRFSKFIKVYTEASANKVYLINCDTYEEKIVQEVLESFGKFKIVNYQRNGHLKLPKCSKNVVKDLNLSSEVALPLDKEAVSELESRKPVTESVFSPVKSECSFELSSDYDAKLEEMVNKTSRQEIMEIILGNVIVDSPTKMPKIDYFTDSNIESECDNNLKRKHSEMETVNNNRHILTPNKLRRLSTSDQISSTTEDLDERSNRTIASNTTRSKYLGRARRVGLSRPRKTDLPNSPSSDKSIENYEQNTPVTQQSPNGKIKTTPRNKVQRYDTSDLYKPKLHYLSRRNNIS